MEKRRRLWLKQVGLGVASIGLANVKSYASPTLPQEILSIADKDNLIFLRSNETPYGPSPLARKVFVEHASSSNRYNWDIADQLISDLANKNNVATKTYIVHNKFYLFNQYLLKYVS